MTAAVRAALLVSLALAQPVAAVEIGSVAAANERVLGTPPAEQPRRLELGQRVVLDERVETSSVGAGQFVFLDQTALTVWPDSDIVLDEYVYDPSTGVGDATITVAKGMLRFIGGRISKNEDVEIRTPHAVIAVRGGVAQVVVTDATTRVMHIAGEYTRIGDLTLSRPTAIAEISVGEAQPRYLGVGDAAQVAQFYGAEPGQGDGGSEGQVDGDVVDGELAASGLAEEGSEDGGAVREDPVSTRGERVLAAIETPGELLADELAKTRIDANADDLLDAAPPPDVRPEPPQTAQPDPQPGPEAPTQPQPETPGIFEPAPSTPEPPETVETPVVPAPQPEAPDLAGPDPETPDLPETVETPEAPESPAPQPEAPDLAGPDPETPDLPETVETPEAPNPQPQAPEGPDAPAPAPGLAGPVIVAIDLGGEGPAAPGLAAGPVAGFTGALHLAPEAGDGGLAVTGPATARLLGGVRGPGLGGYDAVTAEADPLTAEPLALPEIPGLHFLPGAGLLEGRTADVLSFADPGVFMLTAFRTADAGPDATALAFLGAPTPAALWAQVSGADVTVRAYDLGADLFSRAEGMLPPQLGTTFASDGFGELLLIAAPNAAVVPGYVAGIGADPDATNSRWMLGWLAIEGEGADQSSALGVMTAQVLPTEQGQPSASGDFVYVARTAADGPLALGRVALGTLDDGAGVTAFGAGGDYLVLGSAGPYLADADPDQDGVPARHSAWTDAGPVETAFGAARLGVLTGQSVATLASRAPLGDVAAGAAYAGTLRLAGAALFTGGFAAGHGQSFTPAAAAGSRVSEPYLLTTAAPNGVLMAFSPATNGAAAEFSGLGGAAGTGAAVSGVQLNFGGGEGRDALVTDNRFALRDAAAPTGAITGQGFAASGKAGSAPVTVDGRPRQTAFTGALASSGAVGDGGVFEADVDAEPEFLRWGWWSGEARHAGDEADPEFAGRVERMGLGTWVAGVQSDIASVRAATGAATYDGFAVANVVEARAGGPVAYVDGGKFEMRYDFGLRSGSAQISGIAGQTLVATVSEAAAAGGHHYAGALSSLDAAGSGAIRGAFFTGAGDATAATAGAFDFNGVGPGGGAAAISGVYGADRR